MRPLDRVLAMAMIGESTANISTYGDCRIANITSAPTTGASTANTGNEFGGGSEGAEGR